MVLRHKPTGHDRTERSMLLDQHQWYHCSPLYNNLCCLSRIGLQLSFVGSPCPTKSRPSPSPFFLRLKSLLNHIFFPQTSHTRKGRSWEGMVRNIVQILGVWTLIDWLLKIVGRLIEQLVCPFTNFSLTQYYLYCVNLLLTKCKTRKNQITKSDNIILF